MGKPLENTALDDGLRILAPMAILGLIYAAASFPLAVLLMIVLPPALAWCAWSFHEWHGGTSSARRRIAESLLDPRFTSVFEYAPVMMFLLDDQVRMRRANTALLQFTNRAAREILGLSQGEVFGCFHALERRGRCGSGSRCGACRVRRTVLNTLNTGTCHRNVEARLYVARGGRSREMHVQLSTSPLYAGGSRLVLVAIQDLTPQKRTEHELRRALLELKEANRKLKELDRLKSEFVSTASHELRTPLAIIREFVSLVLDRVTGPINEDQRECLDSALSNCDRLGTIINDLLDLERIESGKIRIRRSREDPCAILNRCVQDFLPRCRAKGQDLRAEIPLFLPEVLCDRDKIIQVLVNLIGNAVKFTPEGGRIAVRARAGEGAVCVEVEDDGPGIPAEDQARIFDRFSQLRRKHGDGAKGAGLGLAISRKLMELHEGEIHVESEPGRGAKFTLTLPLYEEGCELEVFVKDFSRRCVEMKKDWSLVLIRAEAAMEGRPVVSLEDVEGIARRTMRLEDAALIIDEKAVLALLVQSNETGVHSLLARLAGAVQESLGEEAALSFAVHGIPEDWSGASPLALHEGAFYPLRDVVSHMTAQGTDRALSKGERELAKQDSTR
jgi:signal transduction histidine kinase